MNQLNHSNQLKDLVISIFQEILAEDPNFFLTDRLSILTWKSKKIEGALITKVGNRRYLGYLRKDIKGQEYWKYKPLTENSTPEQSGESSEIQPTNNLNQLAEETVNSEFPVNDNIAKFNQRQAQVKTYGKQSNHSVEPSTNEQSH